MRLIATIVLWLAAAALPASAQTLEELVSALPDGSFNERAALVAEIAATGDPRAAGLLEALELVGGEGLVPLGGALGGDQALEGREGVEVHGSMLPQIGRVSGNRVGKGGHWLTGNFVAE